MKKENAGQRENSQMESESKIEIISKFEMTINPTLERVQTANEEISSHPNQISILIAEDDQFYFNCIETILLPFDYEILHAKDGQEAVNITAQPIKLI